MSDLEHKRGDSFELMIQLVDDQNQPQPLVDIEISSQVRDSAMRLLADLVVTKEEIAGDASTTGFFSLLCADTTDWPIGKLVFDIKYVIASRISRTETRTIDCKREVTA